MSIFQNILSADTVEGWVIDQLKFWLPTYLREVGRQKDEAIYPLPRSYSIHNRFFNMLEGQTPAIVVVSPGIADIPLKDGDGTYRVKFQIAVAAIVSTNSAENTNRIAKSYAAAIRASVIQQPSLRREEVRGVEWVDEDYTDIDASESRSLGAARVVFNLEVADVVSAQAGPVIPDPPEDPDPDTLPGSEWPTVDMVTVVTEVEEEL